MSDTIKTYRDKLAQADREARATLVCALAVAAFFWLCVLLLKDLPFTIFSLPLWFVLSCLGGYVMSVAAVWVLIKRYMRDFSLEDDLGEYEQDRLLTNRSQTTALTTEQKEVHDVRI
ncbi:MAG: YhdT family protein [Succinivibrio sp.]|nr:YhdT family protein [Succinivibrio sp.]